MSILLSKLQNDAEWKYRVTKLHGHANPELWIKSEGSVDRRIPQSKSFFPVGLRFARVPKVVSDR